MIMDMYVRLRSIQVNDPTKHPIRLRKKNTTGCIQLVRSITPVELKQVQEIEQARNDNCERGKETRST